MAEGREQVAREGGEGEREGGREGGRERGREGGERGNGFGREQRSQRSQRISTSTAYGSPSGPPDAGRIAAGVLVVGAIGIHKRPVDRAPLVDPDRTNDQSARSAARRTRPREPWDRTRCCHADTLFRSLRWLRCSVLRSVVSPASVSSNSTPLCPLPSRIPKKSTCYKIRIGVIKIACRHGPMQC